MSTTFDELVLSIYYSAESSGGPDWATSVIRAGGGGSIANRNINRQDYVSRYEIDYAELDPARRVELRTFAILRNGMARGFRFLAPDDHELLDEAVGHLNPATGEVEYIAAGDGVIDTFYLIKHFSDPANNYTRRIVKPSHLDEFIIRIFNGSNSLQSELAWAAGDGATVYGLALNTISQTDIIPVMGLTSVVLNQWTGTIQLSQPLPSGWRLAVTGTFHLPVAFADDWQKFQVDEVGISSFHVTVEELLPAELGIV